MEFIRAKANEEKKAHTLIAGGYPADFNGEAYQTVAYQNVNLSVRITDEFMTAHRVGGKITTRWVTDPKREGPSYPASELLTEMAACAWQCGCPGVQFHDTINEWHTCSNTGPINASNPCSEFMFLDDSACNLASLNLVKFWDVEARTFDFSKFQAAVRLLITAQDILVSRSSYPTPAIAKNSYRYRPLGLGHANLGGLLMRLGIAYDSDVGRQLAGTLTAAMHFTAYHQSMVLARLLGPFEGFNINALEMTTVISKHLSAFATLMANLSEHPVFHSFTSDLIQFVGNTQWLNPHNSFRNSQVTVLAPTGTIGFMMDCDTTGIEPELGLIKYKNLAGGGTLTIINYGVVSGLMHAFNCDSAKVKPLVDHLNAGGLLEDHSLFRAQPEEIKAIFDCAFQAMPGGRCLSYTSHIKMMAAVQPFLSGAISKTVNMPESATVEDIVAAYVLAYDLGLKSITVYRDNSKGSQPVSTIKKTTAVEPPPNADEDCRQISKRHRLPNTRQSITHKFDISGHEGYLTVGLYEDGNPGELFITMAKEGSMISGLMDAVGVLVSLGLQHGVPLTSIISKLRHTKFDPSGWINTPGPIRTCSSVLDYIFKWMDLTFKDNPEPEPPTKSVPLKAVLNDSKPASSSVASYGPPCYICGCLTVVNGACHKCPNCGESLGCS
jgi:ribonucleoside-diphosphate reductase alpha chain